MKRFIFVMLSLAVCSLFSCKNPNNNDTHNHEPEAQAHDSHEGHDHSSHEGHDHGDHDGHDHGDHEGHDHGDHDGHDHGASSSSGDQLIEISAVQMRAAGIRVTQVKPSSFSAIINTSGSLESVPSEQVEIVALHDGIVEPINDLILEGQEVKKNTPLLRLITSGLTHDNFELGYFEAKRNFLKLKADYERAKALKVDKIMTEKDFLAIEADFKNARALYNEIKKVYTKGGLEVKSGINGYISEVLVKKGQFVTTGEPLLRIQKADRMILKADLPQKYWTDVKNIASANFTTGSCNQVFNTMNLEGKLVSTGKSVSARNTFIPINFEIQNDPALIPGSFCKVYLRTNMIENALCVPNSALLEEMGHFFVFVRLPDGHFVKREVVVGGTDGDKTLIVDGINANDKVVYKGAFQVKMASMSTSIPHGHSH